MEYEKLTDLISKVLNIKQEKIKPTSRFKEDLGADSLDVFQILIEVEEEIQMEVDPEKAEKIHTVDDLWKVLGTKDQP